MRNFYLIALLLIAGHISAFSQMRSLRVQKVWEAAPHNAFPDIRFYKGNFYMVFRESNMHVHEKPEDDGKIRVLISKDGNSWKSFQLIEKSGFDLRDPMLEITSSNKLMLLMGGSIYDGKKLKGAINHVSFLSDKFSKPQPVRYTPEMSSTYNWLWSITWKKGVGYGVIYQFEPGKKNKLMVATTSNGLDYSLKSDLDIPGRTSESKISFINRKNALMVVRRDGNPEKAVFATSSTPFTDWKFKDLPIRLGGPHLAKISPKHWVLSTRGFNEKYVCTSLYALNKNGEVKKLIDLPECGNWDCSYPGMEVHNGLLYISYYSSHENQKTKIFLATISLKEVKKYLR